MVVSPHVTEGFPDRQIWRTVRDPGDHNGCKSTELATGTRRYIMLKVIEVVVVALSLFLSVVQKVVISEFS